MKKIILFLFLAALCYNTFAQSIALNVPDKKFVSAIEVGWDFSNTEETSKTVNIDYTAGMNVGNYWVLGLGSGIKATTISDYYKGYWDKNIGAIPVFFDAKCYMLNTKIHPLLRFRAGYNFLFLKPTDSDVKGGLQLDLTAGVSMGRFFYVAFNYREADYNFESDLNRSCGVSLGLSF